MARLAYINSILYGLDYFPPVEFFVEFSISQQVVMFHSRMKLPAIITEAE